MSFSNLFYDKEAYKQSLNQSVGPGVYTLSSFNQRGQCYPILHR